MKILLVNAPSDHPAAALNKLGLWIPGEQLGICYLAASLRKDGHSVEIIDAFLLGFSAQQVASNILGRADPPDLVGLSISDGKVFGAVGVLKALANLNPRTHLTLGGHTASLCSVELLADYARIDSVVIGEGEATLLHLCKALECGRDWSRLPGLAVRRHGSPRRNPVAPLVDVEALPFPARDNLALCKDAGFCISVETSRGCKGICSFCATRMMFDPDRGPSWRARSVESILQEVEFLIRDHNVRQISFEDEDFLGFGASAGVERAVKFAEEILRRNLKFSWATLTRVDNVNREVFALLRRAGLQLIFIGVENGDQRTLNRYRKETTVDQNREAIRILRALDIPHQILWIMYDPFTDFVALEQNVRFFLEHSTALNINFDNALRVYHGTPLQASLMSKGMLRGNYLEYEYDIVDPKVQAFREATEISLDAPFALVKKLNEVLWNHEKWSESAISEAKTLAARIDRLSKDHVARLFKEINSGQSSDRLIAETRAETLSAALATAAFAATLDGGHHAAK